MQPWKPSDYDAYAKEQPLQGGRTTSGVVRAGNTVRRPPAPNADFVRRLFQHLAAARFEGAAAHLGTDEKGREVFSYIEGEVPADLSHYDDETLHEAGRLIRRLHDLTEAFLDRTGTPNSDRLIVCHNDLSPCNFVFRLRQPVAIIDFDAAAPGTRAEDLGYAAWLWLDLGSDEIHPTEQRRRLALFLDAYGSGGPDLEALGAAILARQQTLIERARQTNDAAMLAWAQACHDWTQRNAASLWTCA